MKQKHYFNIIIVAAVETVKIKVWWRQHVANQGRKEKDDIKPENDVFRHFITNTGVLINIPRP